MNHPPRNLVIDWLNTIWETGLPPSAKLVACCLRRYMNAQNDMAWPSVARITGECGFKSDRTTQAYLKLLCEEGWLGAVGKGDTGTIKYQAQYPAKIAPPANIAPPQNMHIPPANIAPELNKELNNSIRGWDDWVQFRREIRKKLTPSSIKQQVAMLEKYTPAEQQSIINQSIQNGWTGLFPLKDQCNGQVRRAGRGNPRAAESIDAWSLLNTGHDLVG